MSKTSQENIVENETPNFTAFSSDGKTTINLTAPIDPACIVDEPPENQTKPD
tara:strand:- start:433 stop:588 length:156 start_codon:yes stop_codon:yes gene_type:complete